MNSKEKVDVKAMEKELKQDPDYRKANILYRTGMIILCVMMIVEAVFALMKIQIVIGETFCNYYFYPLLLIPLVMVNIGLYQIRNVSKKHNNYRLKSNTMWLYLFAALGVLIVISGIMAIIKSPYNHAKTEEVTLHSGEQVLMVSMNKRDDIIPIFHVQDQYTIEVYQNFGPFKKRIIASEPSPMKISYTIEKGENNKSILVVSEGTKGQIYYID